MFKDPAYLQFSVGSKHLDDEDDLVYETTRVVVLKGFIVAYRRLVTSGDSKPCEEAAPIYVSDVARMTVVLLAPPSDDSVYSAITTPSGTPKALQPSITVYPNRKLESQLPVPPQSSAVPGGTLKGGWRPTLQQTSVGDYHRD